MKRLYIYTIISIVLLCLSGCTQREDVQIPVQTVNAVFTAVMEGDEEQTKVLLGQEEEDGYRALLWEPGDSIRILCRTIDYAVSSTGHIFTNTETSNTSQAIFEGTMCNSYDVLAVYPGSIWSYQPMWRDSVGESYYYNVLDIPNVQTYRENNISRKAVPMVAFKSLDKDKFQGNLEFRNLFGVLALNIKGEDKIRAITMTAKDADGNTMPLSGFADVKRRESDFYIVRMHNVTADGMAESGRSSVTLECPDVQLSTSTPTAFHIALPPGTYSSFQLIITTAEGEFMKVESNKELVINRSKIKHTTPLSYVASVSIDLSERGTSNSYIVSDAGLYSFDASVIGNGADGIIPGANFHTDNPAIEPASAEILWETPSGTISNVTFDSETKRLSFIASGSKGNAVVAAKDANGTILWSWHIWHTDQPAEHTYINYQNQTIVVQDRNLGATRADKGIGEQWKESIGLSYQWGRKDPFTVGKEDVVSYKITIQESIQYPRQAANGDGGWLLNSVRNLWTDSTKTIYDPCPVGYKVAPRDTWSGFTAYGSSTYQPSEINWTGVWDNGLYFIYDGVNSAWYPRIYMGPSMGLSYNEVECWSSYSTSWDGDYWTGANRLYVRYDSDREVHVDPYSGTEHRYSRAVRCVKDEKYVDQSIPKVSITSVDNITTTSVTLSAEVTDKGVKDVISRGFVLGTTHNPTIESGIKVSEGSGLGEYTVTASGLSPMTQYYVRAFASNDRGVAYSQERNFYTAYDGIPTNLSTNGTSNCYIVSAEGYYSIDASVMGNGSKGIIPNSGFHTSNPAINPAYAEIVWEDRDSLITYYTYDATKKTINFWARGIEGNALIAAKDENGTILWSWHIWITDKPVDHSYFNYNKKNYIVMDRNIGATRADRGTGEEWRESAGLIYQWGRKDPFAMGRYTQTSDQMFIERTVLEPNVMSTDSDWSRDSWTGDYSLWTDTLKTIYDPCPLGYRMPARDVWSGFTTTGNSTSNEDEFNISGPWDRGYWYYYDGVNTAWYPQTYYGTWYGENQSSVIWIGKGNESSANYFECNPNHPITTWEWWASSGDCRAVRCVKDQTYNDPSLPSVIPYDVTEITESQAKFQGEVTSQGTYEVVERGFVYGIRSDVALNIDTATKIVCGMGEGPFEHKELSLTPGTEYSVRCYAVNSMGDVVYSETKWFKTKETGSNEDLAEDEWEW